MNREKISKQIVKDHHLYKDPSGEELGLWKYVEYLPCINCLVQPACIQRIYEASAQQNEDPTYEDDEKCEGNVDEFIEWAVTRLLADMCPDLEIYMYMVNVVDTGYGNTYLLETIKGYFGQRAGMWFYQPEN